MIGWILLALYVIGWAGFSVTITRVLVKDLSFTGEEMATSVRASCVLLGMMGALFWPVVIPGGWVYKRVFAPGKDKEDG